MVKTLRQISSGGVVFRKNDGQIEVALAAREKGRIWCLPKGLVEPGESLEGTAIREVREETGLEGEIAAKIGQIKYWYSRKEGYELVRHFKIVHFYLIRYKGGDVRDHDWEVDEVRWFPIDEAIERLSYKSEKEIMLKAKAMLSGEDGAENC